MPMTASIKALVAGWHDSGIESGDMVLLHSSLIKTLHRYHQQDSQVDTAAVLESFLSALGPEGTLLLPLFNFDFTRGVPFDIRSTPSHMGSLTEAGRQHREAVRTGHPIYSFAVIGARAQEFEGVVNFSGYGADSPFGLLHRGGGKIAVLDLPDQSSMTFHHYVEEALDVPYRYHKTFTGPFTDAAGHSEERTFGLFVRDLDKGVETYVTPMEEHLWQAGLYKGCRPGEGNGLRTIEASLLFDATADVIKAGKAEGMLYRIKLRDA